MVYLQVWLDNHNFRMEYVPTLTDARLKAIKLIEKKSYTRRYVSIYRYEYCDNILGDVNRTRTKGVYEWVDYGNKVIYHINKDTGLLIRNTRFEI